MSAPPVLPASNAPAPDSEMAENGFTPADWPLRPWLLAVFLAVIGLLIYWVTDNSPDYEKGVPRANEVPWRMACAAFLFFGGIATAFSVEPDRASRLRILRSPLIYGLGVAAIMAGIAWRVTAGQDGHSDAPFWMASGIVAAVVSMPLFKAGFHKHWWRTSYKETHRYVWSDAICCAGALAFTGLSWALIAVLAELFDTIQITFLKDLLDKEYFGWIFSGFAFGAALGVLRNQLKILGTLQSVVLLVLSLLAVPFAIALVLFILAVALSGMSALWNATSSATPLLMVCAVGAFVLANAVVRDDDADSSKSRILRITALVLALAVLPLSIMAAFSIGVRIDQHGLSPQRIWSAIAVGLAVVYGAAYLFAAVKGRRAAWRNLLRRMNLYLAVFTCAFGIILALPILDFGAISTKNQLARLENGTVSAEDFDYGALRWDFGEAGKKALAQLVKSKNPEIAENANLASAQTSRYYRSRDTENSAERKKRLANVRMDFDNPRLRKHVESRIIEDEWRCEVACIAVDLGEKKGKQIVALLDGDMTYDNLIHFEIDLSSPLPGEKGFAQAEEARAEGAVEANAEVVTARTKKITPNSKVEVREWKGRQIYVDGQPAGDPFE